VGRAFVDRGEVATMPAMPQRDDQDREPQLATPEPREQPGECRSGDHAATYAPSRSQPSARTAAARVASASMSGPASDCAHGAHTDNSTSLPSSSHSRVEGSTGDRAA
jgi:hypothetical protein